MIDTETDFSKARKKICLKSWKWHYHFKNVFPYLPFHVAFKYGLPFQHCSLSSAVYLHNSIPWVSSRVSLFQLSFNMTCECQIHKAFFPYDVSCIIVLFVSSCLKTSSLLPCSVHIILSNLLYKNHISVNSSQRLKITPANFWTSSIPLLHSLSYSMVYIT